MNNTVSIGSMSDVMGLRLRDDEKKLIERAAELEAPPGDRGGASAWARRVLLREAQRVVDANVPSL
jgi:hypothetical protein